jgi:thioesterase domain-containing protein
MARSDQTGARHYEEAATMPAKGGAHEPAQLAASGNDDQRTTVLKIIGRTLRRKDLTPEDNYLALCHDLRRTIIIIREIERRFAVQLPLTLFMEAETISAIAGAVVTRAIPASRGIVTLKPAEPASSLPPLFVFPGIGGAVMELADITQTIDYAGPIYGLPYRGLDGHAEPSPTIAPLAEESWKRIKSVQATGPYFLLGYSAGGYVALETARLIEADRQHVGLLGMIEAGIHERFWPFGKWLTFMIGRMRQQRGKRPSTDTVTPANKEASRQADGSSRARLLKKAAAIGQKLSRIQTRVGHRYGNPLRPGYAASSSYYIGNLPSLLQAVRDMSIVLLASYKFRPYNGRTIYFRSETGDPLSCDPETMWRRFLPDILFEQLPGDHASMIAPPHAQMLAARIRRYLPHIQEHADRDG